MVEKILKVNSEWPMKSVSECLIEGNKALASKIDKAYDELVEEFSANREDAQEAADNYAIVAEDLGVQIVAEDTGKQETTVPQDEGGEEAGEIEVIRVNRKGVGSIKAFCDVAYSGLIMKGFRIVENAEGMFVGFPSKENEGEWYPLIYTKNQSLRDKIAQKVMAAYIQ